MKVRAKVISERLGVSVRTVNRWIRVIKDAKGSPIVTEEEFYSYYKLENPNYNSDKKNILTNKLIHYEKDFIFIAITTSIHWM